MQAALQKWLSNYIKVQSVVASADEAVLTVTVSYSLLNTDVTAGADLRLRRQRRDLPMLRREAQGGGARESALNGIDYLEVLGFDADPLGACASRR